MHKNDYHKYHQRTITNSDMILIYGNLKFLQRTEGVSILVLGSANPKADIIRNFRKQLASKGYGFNEVVSIIVVRGNSCFQTKLLYHI